MGQIKYNSRLYFLYLNKCCLVIGVPSGRFGPLSVIGNDIKCIHLFEITGGHCL